MFGKYSFNNMLKEYYNNKELIHAYIKGDSIEGYNDDKGTTIMGLGIVMFMFVFFIVFALWIWALVVTIKYWNVLPSWAQIIAILSLIGMLGGPVVTLIVVYIVVGSQSGSSKAKLSSAFLNFRI